MSDLLTKCSVCGALLDEEDLFCANCGTAAPQAGAATQSQEVSHSFECGGCGASMSYDAKVQTLRCPFCGGEQLSPQTGGRTILPEFVIPFAVSREQAESTMRAWLSRGWLRPNDLSATAQIAAMSAVYVPFWVFSATTFTYFTADSSQTPRGAAAPWFPVSGSHQGSYQGLLIGASSALTPGESAAICPFDLSPATPPDQVDTSAAAVEQFRVQRKYARPLAQRGLEDLERAACAELVPGRARKVQVNVRVQDLSSRPVLLPVWIMTYRYHDRLFRFLLNGQTAKATGEAPSSWRKKLLIVAGVVFALVVLLKMLGG